MARYPLNLPLELKREAEQMADNQGISLNQFILWSVAEKVGSLRQGLDDPRFPNITYMRGMSGFPMPVLRGRNLRVQTISIENTKWKQTPAQISANHDIDEKLAIEALAFYEAHKPEIDENIKHEIELEASHA